MRPILIAIFSLTSTSAIAWEFTPGTPCLLTHEMGQSQVQLTYDPSEPLYTITVTQTAPWPDAHGFEIRFEGPKGRTIGTDRHVLSADRRSLTVTDRGFGNVLDGLQFNQNAIASSGDVVVSFSLGGAKDAVAAFRACESALPVS